VGARSYEEACEQHRWEVPDRYNIAADVCDRHDPEKPAMVHESFDGTVRELRWGELQALSNQAANVLAGAGVERGDRVAVVLPPTPEAAAIFFGTWKLGAVLLSMSVLYGDDGIRHRLTDSEPTALVTDRANAGRFEATGSRLLILDDGLLEDASGEFETVETAADDPAQLYYTSGTTGMAKGIVHAHRRTPSVSTGWGSGRGRPESLRCSARGALAPSSASTSARADSIRTASSTSSAGAR
jgi:acetyl-CoA synthetase